MAVGGAMSAAFTGSWAAGITGLLPDVSGCSAVPQDTVKSKARITRGIANDLGRFNQWYTVSGPPQIGLPGLSWNIRYTLYILIINYIYNITSLKGG
jgi:hypothetical protein